MPQEITCQELNDLIQQKEEMQLIDVREQSEYDYCRIANSLLIPLGDVKNNSEQIRKDIPVIVYCHHGIRSMNAIMYLESRFGFTNLKNLKGGIHAWSLQIDDTVAVY